ncbi:MAG TPA: carboxymuconolactone decarboxylase family protein [Steroidobacteraceae bacterium]|jgi:alkyl hydroperoxide reductase subunit D
MDNASLDQMRESIPDYARDLKLNLGSVLSTAGAPGLSDTQIWAVAVACAIAARNPSFARAIEAAAGAHLDAAHLQAARSAASIMGMNNVYYRFLHLVEDSEYQSLPARLRMNVLANPGIDKLSFELLSLAVSAINGCGLCISSHENKLREHGYSREMIQSAVRIAATINAVAGVLEYAHSEPVSHSQAA